MSEAAEKAPAEAPAAGQDHLNIKVTDSNNEVFFKIKRSTQLKKLMDAFCERQGRQMSTVRFLFDGTRVRPEDTPDSVRTTPQNYMRQVFVIVIQLLTHPDTARHGRWGYARGSPGTDRRVDVAWTFLSQRRALLCFAYPRLRRMGASSVHVIFCFYYLLRKEKRKHLRFT